MIRPQLEFALPDDFYSVYWQRKPIVIRAAIANFVSPLSPDELAGLACMDGVESRIVAEKGCATPWEVRHGPFEEKIFATLPETHWSLLVQAVDHWDDDVAALRRLFPTIPNWRIDDVMVSYAADGGSVGPHFDHYDVFLLQGQGQRRWLLGGPVRPDSKLEGSMELQLLRDFEVEKELVLQPGDALYIPPGYAHWGIADGECLTYSIGFRAPSNSEIVDGFAAEMVEGLAEHDRYRDPAVIEVPPPHPGEITDAVVRRLHDIVSQHLTQPALAQWFGAYVTERKYPSGVVDIDEAVGIPELDRHAVCIPCKGSRFAFINRDGALSLYADGRRYVCPAHAQRFVIGLCDGLPIASSDLVNFREIVLALLRNGSLEIT